MIDDKVKTKLSAKGISQEAIFAADTILEQNKAQLLYLSFLGESEYRIMYRLPNGVATAQIFSSVKGVFVPRVHNDEVIKVVSLDEKPIQKEQFIVESAITMPEPSVKERVQQFIKTANSPISEVSTNTISESPKKRGRVAVIRPAVVWPQTETFTMADMLAVNPEYTQPTLYIKIQTLMGIQMEEAGNAPHSGRGKPAKNYKQIIKKS